MARKNNEVVNTAIITPDKHCPIHDETAINIVSKAIKTVKPHIHIDFGDTGELEYFSNPYWKGKNENHCQIWHKGQLVGLWVW